MTIPPRIRNPPERPKVSKIVSIITGNTKLPKHAPERAIPDAVARYFRKYWLTTTWNRVLAKAKPNPKGRNNKPY